MSTSNTVTKTDLQNIINAIFPATTEDMTEAQIEAFVNSLDRQKIGKPYESKDLLWTNPSPTAAFATQTIAIDTSYDAYEIEYIGYTGQPNVKSVIKISGSESFLWHITSAAGTGDDGTASTLYFFKRHVTVAAAGLTFGKVYYNNQNAATATWGEYTANTGCVPYKIYGIKIVSGLVPIGDYQSDYVIEQGTNNDWTYRKWNNGTYEAWMNYSVSDLAITNSSAGTYYHSPALTVNAPSFSLSITFAQATPKPSIGSGIIVYTFVGKTATTLELNFRAHASVSTATASASFYIVGTWK